MGAHLVRRYITETDTEPDPARKYEFDPQLGFPERKERGLSSEKHISSLQRVLIGWRGLVVFGLVGVARRALTLAELR